MKRQVAVAGNSLERKSSFLSDGTLESICESETSTAPSSLQTIIRAPYVLSQPSQPAQTEPELLSSAHNLRKVSEQLLNTSRTRNSLSVSSPAISRLPVSRPSSQQSNSSSPVVRPPGAPGPPGPSGPPGAPGAPGIPNSQTGREHRPNSFAGPPNTVGLPVASPVPTSDSSCGSKSVLPHSAGSKLPKLTLSSNYQESPGLLSTISQAAISDDESPPASQPPPTHKFNTAVLSLASPPGRDRETDLPNYENVEKQQMMTQGQYRAAAAQAKVATIPGEESSAYISMGVRRSVVSGATPLATSSPSGIPRYSSTVK